MTSEQTKLIRDHFCKFVDLRSNRSMRDWLKNHPRYDTMGPWNASTSYAHCIKINQIPIPDHLTTDPYDMIGMDEWQSVMSGIMREFDESHKYEWQVGTNGRSGGYVVLYHGGRKSNGTTYCCPGKSLDMGEDFDDWDKSDLTERVKLVQEFDSLVVDIVTSFVDFCESFQIISKTIQVEQEIQVLEEIV